MNWCEGFLERRHQFTCLYAGIHASNRLRYQKFLPLTYLTSLPHTYREFSDLHYRL